MLLEKTHIVQGNVGQGCLSHHFSEVLAGTDLHHSATCGNEFDFELTKEYFLSTAYKKHSIKEI